MFRSLMKGQAIRMIRRAAWMLDRQMPCGEEANLAKYLAAEAGFAALGAKGLAEDATAAMMVADDSYERRDATPCR